MSRRTILWLLLAVAVVAAGSYGIWWWVTHRRNESNELRLYGNIDLRQVQLAFKDSERIRAVKVEEGDSVKQGDVLAVLDDDRLNLQIDQAEAMVVAQQRVVDRIKSGKPKEVDQADANLKSAIAEANNAQLQFDRLKNLETVQLRDKTKAKAVSQEDIDNARAALDVANAKVDVNQKALDLVKNTRYHDEKENTARLEAQKKQLAYLRRQHDDTELKAPSDGVIRTRLLEPGDMASPQRPVFTIAITNPKWVRAYVSEPDLAKIRKDMPVTITVDSFPNEPFDGWIGFISSVAEFTPKTVQTEELRSSLVYEVRVFIKDPKNRLPLGMPATVHVPLGPKEP
jgi:HlyD family secretion protein